MDAQAILDELVAILEKSHVVVRTEPMGGAAGGLCKVKDRMIFFVDRDASTTDNAVACAQAVRRLVDVESVYLRPGVREFLESHAPAIDGETPSG